jgi:hypothetical protein
MTNLINHFSQFLDSVNLLASLFLAFAGLTCSVLIWVYMLDRAKNNGYK